MSTMKKDQSRNIELALQSCPSSSGCSRLRSSAQFPRHVYMLALWCFSGKKKNMLFFSVFFKAKDATTLMFSNLLFSDNKEIIRVNWLQWLPSSPLHKHFIFFPINSLLMKFLIVLISFVSRSATLNVLIQPSWSIFPFCKLSSSTNSINGVKHVIYNSPKLLLWGLVCLATPEHFFSILVYTEFLVPSNSWWKVVS